MLQRQIALERADQPIQLHRRRHHALEEFPLAFQRQDKAAIGPGLGAQLIFRKGVDQFVEIQIHVFSPRKMIAPAPHRLYATSACAR
ncbi:hypothetical protein D3C78_1855500 [compost metagenome]